MGGNKMNKETKKYLKAQKALGSAAKKELRKHNIKKGCAIGGSVIAAGALVGGGIYLYKHHEREGCGCSSYTDNSFNY